MSSAKCYPTKAPEVNDLLDTLSCNLRRELIHYFETVTSGDTASLDEVVSHIDGRVPTTDPTALRVSLHHSHLPKLQHRGWIAYDAQDETIFYEGNENAADLLAEVIKLFGK